jgi:hypothetical protein
MAAPSARPRAAAPAAVRVRGRRPAPRPRCSAASQPSAPPPPPPPPLRAWPAARSWSEVALSKLLDTAEDVALIARRTLAPAYSRDLRADATQDGALALGSSRPVVLILGAGWAAHSLMKVIDTDLFEARRATRFCAAMACLGPAGSPRADLGCAAPRCRRAALCR